MKKWTITVNLLFYITFLNQWKAVESQQTSSSRGGQSAGTSPAGGQTSTPKSQNQSASSSSQSQSSQSSSQPASSGSRAAQPTRSGGTTPGTPTSGTSSTPASQSQSRSSQSSSQPASSGSQSQSVKTASQPASPSGGTTQPPKASGTGTPASPSGGTTQPPKASTAASPSGGTTQPPKASGTSSTSQSQPGKPASQPTSTSSGSTPASQTPTSQSSSTPTQSSSTPTQSSSQSTGTGTSAGQVSKSPITESQPKSSSSATDQSSSGTGESQAKGGPVTKPENEVISPTVAKQTGSIKSTEPPPEKAIVTVIAPTGKPRPKKTPEVISGHRTAITLDIGEKSSNSAVDFKEDYLKNVMVFSAMEKYVFNKIVKTSRSKCCGKTCSESETVIWEASGQSEYFHKVYVDGLGTFSSTSNLSIHLCNGTFKHFNKPTFGDWSESPGVVDLDVNISNSNIQVDYFKKDNYRIYAAKPGYTIRKVMKSKKCSSDCCCSPNVIWEAHDEHALKVVLMGSKKEPKHLAVLLKSGELTLLFKSGKGEPWQDITSSKNKITDLKMYAMADDKETVELHKGHYSITLFNEFYGYVFYDGVGCVKVTHKGKNIWDLREEGDFGCLKGVFLDLKSNKFNVMNDDDRCWVCEEVRKVNPVTLDISSKASTDDFDFTVDHNRNIMVYTTKGNAMFYQVVKRSSTGCCGSTCSDSETVIWETEDPQKYASKVFADGVGACSSTKNVSIYLLNGDILHFSEGDNAWKKSDSKIILDVSKTSSTIGYDFVHHGETRTFTTKPGYLFKTVMLSSSWTWLVCGSSCCKSGCLSDHIFWEAERDDECSNKVTVYGVKTSVTNINIFLKNNEVKHFHKVDDKWVTKTTIVLNIEKNTDNDLFEYRSTRHFGHFNPKPNLTITKIVKKDLEIWTAKADDHGLKAVLMGSGKDEKFLSILLQSGNFVLLRKCGKGECWEDITQEKSDFSGIKMYSLEEGTSNYHELTETDYDPIVFESRYGHEFKEGVKCVKITYNDKLLWNHTDDPEFGYLKGLYLDLPKDRFSVTNLKDQTKQLTKAVTNVALDINTSQSTTEFDFNEHNGVITYRVKSGYVFSKVSQGATAIWVSKDNVFGTLVMSKTSNGVKYLVVLLTNKMFKLFHLEVGKSWREITSQRHDISKLKFLGDDDVVLSPSDYKVTIMDLSYQYIFKDGVICKKIKYNDVILWKHSDDPKFSEIMKFHLGLISDSFFVKNSSEFKKLDFKGTPEKAAVSTRISVTKPAEPTKVTVDIEKTESTSEFDYTDHNGVVTYTPKDDHVFSKVSEGTTVIWESKDEVCGTLVRTKVSKNVKFLVVLLTNNMFTLFHLDVGEWKDITSDRHDVTMLKFLAENDAELTKTDYSVTIVDLSFTYIFNTGVKCKKVKLGEDEIWKHTDDTKFAEIKSFSLGLASNSFFVKNQSDDVKKIEEKAEAEAEVPEPEAPEAEAPDTKPNITIDSLDINTSQTTTELDYSKSSDFHKYNPKPGYVFNKVAYDITVIWESKNYLYGTEVMFIEGVKYLAILMTNNNFLLFEQHNDKWHDTTSKRHDVTKVKFFGENNVELTKSDYNASFVDFFYRLKFNTNVKCVRITYNNNELWSHTDDPKFAEITLFSLGLASNSFFVKSMSGHCKKLPEPAVPTKQQAPTKEAEESEQTGTPEESTEAEDPATPAEPAESKQPEETVSSEQSTPDTSSASSS